MVTGSSSTEICSTEIIQTIGVPKRHLFSSMFQSVVNMQFTGRLFTKKRLFLRYAIFLSDMLLSWEPKGNIFENEGV